MPPSTHSSQNSLSGQSRSTESAPKEIKESRVGNYAVTTNKSRPWLSTPIVPPQSKTRRSRGDPIIVNPIFEDCSKLATDPFWINLFHMAAAGKLPRGFMYRNGLLTHKRGLKVSRIEIPIAPVEALSATMSFLMKMGGIMSEFDQEQARQRYNNLPVSTLSIQTCQWSDIKNPHIKELVVNNFVQEVVETYKIEKNEKKDLATTIHIGFILGKFQDKHIQFESGRIRSIDGLNFDAKTRQFSIDPSFLTKISKNSGGRKGEKRNEDRKNVSERSTESESSHREVRNKESYGTKWIKFIQKLEKKIPLSDSSVSIINSPSMILHSKGISSQEVETDETLYTTE